MYLSCLNSGIDIKDIPNVNDRDFSITLNGFFLVRWRDPRLIIENVDFGENESLIPVDVSLVDSIWMPDIEILNLKEFATLDVLSKLEGLWLNKDLELIYAVACRITWICPMTFDSFPLDVQVLERSRILKYHNSIECTYTNVSCKSRTVLVKKNSRFADFKLEASTMTQRRWFFTTNL